MTRPRFLIRACALLLLLAGCRSTGSRDPEDQLGAVQRALAEHHVAQMGEYALRATTVERERDVLRCAGVRLANAEGVELVADQGTLVDQGDAWRMDLVNAYSEDARGNSTRVERLTLVWLKD